MTSKGWTEWGWALLSLLVASACFDFKDPELLPGDSGAGGSGGVDGDAPIAGNSGTPASGGTSSESGGDGGNGGTNGGTGDNGGSSGTSGSGGSSGGSGGTAGTSGAGGGAGNGGAAGAGACDTDAPFMPPTPLASLNTLDVESGITLSADQRTAYFASDRERDNMDLFSATRTDEQSPFDNIAELGLLNDSYSELQPSLSFDGLTLFFDVNGIVQIATRSSTDAEFESSSEVSPGGELSGNDDPFVTADDGELYFSSIRVSTNAGWNIFVSTISQSGALGPPIEVPVVNTEYDEFAPVLSTDELTLYFESDREYTGFMDDSNIWMARRSTKQEDFGEPEFVDELNVSPEDEYPEALSPDGCTIYFVSRRSGNSDIYVASKPPLEP